MSAAPTTAGWLRTAVHRVSRGSGIVVLRLTGRGAKAATRRARKVQEGVRGWLGEASGVLDTLLRWLLLYVAVRVGWVLLRAVPGVGAHLVDRGRWLLWPAVIVFVIAAYRAGDPDAEQPKAEPEPAEESEAGPVNEEADPDDEPPATLDRDGLTELLHELLGERGGVHLSVLRTALRKHVPGLGWDRAEALALLADAGVRVRPGVRDAGDEVREGVHRDDVPPLPSPAWTDPCPPVVAAADLALGNNNNGNNAPAALPVVVDESQGATIIRLPGEARRYTA